MRIQAQKHVLRTLSMSILGTPFGYLLIHLSGYLPNMLSIFVSYEVL